MNSIIKKARPVKEKLRTGYLSVGRKSIFKLYLIQRKGCASLGGKIAFLIKILKQLIKPLGVGL